MSELGDAEKASILRGFTARAATLAQPAQQRKWRWAPGTVLFPEGICPYCRAVMRSNRIWMLGEHTLNGQVRIQPPASGEHVGRLVREQAEHPHVRGTSICTGSSESAEAALFLGITPGDTYWGRGGAPVIKQWLRKMFLHQCGTEGDIAEPSYTPCPVCLTDIPNGEGHLRTTCARVRCTCGCGCYPEAHENCYCGCSSCRCRERRQMATTHVYPGSASCGHTCCRECCRNANCNYAGGYSSS